MSAAPSSAVPNPLLPVLHALDPTHPWPETLEPSSIQVLDANTLRLVERARGFAEDAEQRARPAGGVAPPAGRTDVHLMRWASRAGRYADQVVHAAGLFAGDHAGEALRSTITAALMAREAEFDTGNSGERHHKSVLNRALAAAEWVRLSLRTSPIDAPTAALLFEEEALPPGWRWQTRPTTSAGDANEARLTFSITREQPRDDEWITLTGSGTQPVTIFRSYHGTSDSLSWGEMCRHIAASQTRPLPDPPRRRT